MRALFFLTIFTVLGLSRGFAAEDRIDPAQCRVGESGNWVIDGCLEEGRAYDRKKDSWTTPGLAERTAELCGEIARYAWLAVSYRDRGWSLEDEMTWALENLGPGEMRNLIVLSATEAYLFYPGPVDFQSVWDIVWPRCMNYVPASEN